MRPTPRVIYGTVIAGLLVVWGSAVVGQAHGDRRPSNQEIAFAQQVSDLMVNEIVAALFTEFDETTPANVPHGKQAISLIFNDLNRNMRLIGAFSPLQGGRNNRPSGSFERAALDRALVGEPHTAVQRENETWFYRRSVPLSNTFHANCVLCHSNFTPAFFANTNNPGQWVGALVLAVPIGSDEDD
jgi:hypothetical protein